MTGDWLVEVCWLERYESEVVVEVMVVDFLAVCWTIHTKLEDL